jgi:predicted nucleic-acid-binding protein
MPIALDTNVLMRFLTQDDIGLFEIAQGIINSCGAMRPAFICREVLMELVRLLERFYKYCRNEIWLP